MTKCMHCGEEMSEEKDVVIMDHRVGQQWEKWFLCGWMCLRSFVTDELRDEVLGEIPMSNIG